MAQVYSKTSTLKLNFILNGILGTLARFHIYWQATMFNMHRFLNAKVCKILPKFPISQFYLGTHAYLTFNLN